MAGGFPRGIRVGYAVECIQLRNRHGIIAERLPANLRNQTMTESELGSAPERNRAFCYGSGKVGRGVLGTFLMGHD